jgi:hypothetical protein
MNERPDCTKIEASLINGQASLTTLGLLNRIIGKALLERLNVSFLLYWRLLVEQVMTIQG